MVLGNAMKRTPLCYQLDDLIVEEGASDEKFVS